MRTLTSRDLFRRSDDDELTAIASGFGTEIDDVVGAFDDVEIVLDDDDRVTRRDETLEHFQEHAGIVEMQARGRFVKNEDGGFGVLSLLHGRGEEMSDELEPLAFSAREGVERLAEAQIAETDIGEQLQALDDTGRLLVRHREEVGNRRGYRHREKIVDRFPLQLDLERLGRVAFALALGTGHVEIAEELHFHFLITIAHAAPAAAGTAVEGKIAGSDAAGLAVGRFGEELADGLEDARVNRRRRTRCPCERSLIDHDDFADVARSAERLALSDLCLGGGEAEF